MPRGVAGLHVMVKVDSVAREQALIAKANGVGVEMNALSDYWLPDSTEPVDNRAGLVLGFAGARWRPIAAARGLVRVVPLAGV